MLLVVEVIELIVAIRLSIKTKENINTFVETK